MVLLFAITLLLLAFVIHVFWWHIRMPRSATLALLFLFTTVIALFITFSSLTTHQLVELMLLYSSCALVYVILYSAIEQQSPTLAIVEFIHRFGEEGCDESALYQHVCPDEEMTKRLQVMQQSGWVKTHDGHSYLSQKGVYLATLFYYSSAIFGLRSGG
jgi:hypothetical protein